MSVIISPDDGFAYERVPANYFRIKGWEKAGHLELHAHKPMVSSQLDWSAERIRDFQESEAAFYEANKERLDKERADRNLKRAAQRAKTNVRRLCKAGGCTSLLTLTYRANVGDLEECKRDLKEFVRRLRGELGEFVAVAAFEKQRRGCWHVHLATKAIAAVLTRPGGIKMKSFELIRSVWRSVTKDKGGNIDMQRRKRTSQRSAARLAAYLSKYILKCWESGEKWVNRWTRFGAIDAGEAVALGEVESALEAIALVYGFTGSMSIATVHWSRFGDSFYVAAEG